MCLWRRATIDELSSIFACVQWKRTYFISFLAGLWTLWAPWLTGWAVISGQQFPFYFTDEFDIRRTTSLSTERRPMPPIQHLHPSLNFPLPATSSHKHWHGTEALGKTFVWHCKLQGDVSSRFSLGCEWKNKTWFTSTNPSGRALLCQRLEWFYTARRLYSRHCMWKNRRKKRILEITLIPRFIVLTGKRFFLKVELFFSPTLSCSRSRKSNLNFINFFDDQFFV